MYPAGAPTFENFWNCQEGDFARNTLVKIFEWLLFERLEELRRRKDRLSVKSRYYHRPGFHFAEHSNIATIWQTTASEPR